MALWAGTTLNTNRFAQVFNQLWDTKGVAMVRVNNGFLYAILGKDYGKINPRTGSRFERLSKISGDQIELKLLGKLDSYSTVDNGSAELASATPTWDSAYWGAVKFPFTHYFDVRGIPSSEYNQFRGSEAKTESFIDETMEQIMLSQEETFNTAMQAEVVGATTTVLGNWQHAASDGVSTGETTYATYGLDRSDSANAKFRGVVHDGIGDITVPALRAHKNAIRDNGGRVDLGVTGVAIYGKLQTLFDGYVTTTHDENWVKFNGDWVGMGGTKYVMDGHTADGHLGHFTSDTWRLWQKKVNMVEGGFQKAGWLKTGYVLPWEIFMQLLCKKPNSNGKMKDINH